MIIVKNSAGKIIYWTLIILSLVIGLIIYGVLKDQYSMQFLVFFSGIPFLLFVVGVFGLLLPAIKPTGDGSYIIHALIIGAFFIILFFIHVWLILPKICPEFGNCLFGS
jgi:hypothetical protein